VSEEQLPNAYSILVTLEVSKYGIEVNEEHSLNVPVIEVTFEVFDIDDIFVNALQP
jgi:hypothetical protein